MFRVYFLVWSWSPRDSQESSPVPQFEIISSSALSLTYGPTLTFVLTILTKRIPETKTGVRPKSSHLTEESVQLCHSIMSKNMIEDATPRTAAHQASLSITNSWSLLTLMSIKSVMPSNHLIFCHPLHLLPSIFPSIRVFSSESVLRIRWPKY